MNLIITLVLVVWCSSTEAENYNEYSTFVTDEDFDQQFFSDDLDDTSYTPKVEDLNESRYDTDTVKYTTVDATKMSYPSADDWEMEKNKRNKNVGVDDSKNFDLNFDQSDGQQILNSNRENEMTSEKLLGHFSPIFQRVYKNYEESFQNKDTDLNQAPMRREINAWRDEFSNLENVPWNLDAFYPRHGSPNSRNEYFDDSGYPADSTEQKMNASSETPPSLKDLIEQDDHPYYQKNYYYNYYPPVHSQKSNIHQWGASDERDAYFVSNSSFRRPIRKNPCKQYLQFLKYAFEKLDEGSDYNYDYNDDSEDWKFKGERRPKVYAVHLLGPTLFVDNSGKVSQINAKENSYQNVDKMAYIPKNLAGLPMTMRSRESNYLSTERARTTTTPRHLDDFRVRATTFPPYASVSPTRTQRPITSPNFNYYEQPKTTTEQPWLLFSLRTNLTSNATKEQKMNPDIQHRSSFGARVEQEEWRQHMGDETFETTVRTKTEHMVFDEYDYGDTKPSHPPVNTYPPLWFPSDEYYQKLAKALEKKENDTKSNAIASETNAAVGSPVYMYSRTSLPQTTTLSPIFIKSTRYESTEGPRHVTDKKDDDCNDKMLPCPDTVNVTYPLNGYCNRYVSCESGRAIRKTCPEGLHFNIVTKSCDLPHNSFCSYVCPEPNGLYGIPGDCNGFFTCKNHIPEYRMCPPRMHWDINRGTCTFAELSSCPMKCTKLNEVTPYEGDCKAYIICLNGIPYYHKCPPTSKFDRDAQSCIPDDQSRCEDDPRLLTKTTNPNYLCRNVEVKLGTKVWCNHFFPEESHNTRNQFEH